MIEETLNQILRWVEGPIVITSGPGCGKTTAAGIDALYLTSIGLRVLVVTFTNGAVTELCDKGVVAMTIDAFYFRCLRQWHELGGFNGKNFNLLQIRFSEMLKTPDFLKWVRNLYDVVILDEGQDTNKAQLKSLWEVSQGELHVFGDIDQCIYEWRGAQPNVLLEFCVNHGIEPVPMPYTHRLTKQVLKASRNVIKHNVKRFSTPVKTDKEGPEVEVEIGLYDVEATMERLKQINSNDVAVLSRNVKRRGFLKDFWAQGLDKSAESHKPYCGSFHGAKGLEWKNVFIIRADVREFQNEPLEEARRLFYTGMTRSENFLHISAFEPICFVKEMGI